MKRLLLFAMAIIFAMQLSAQTTTITVGDTNSTTTTSYVPMYYLYENSYTQTVYPSEALTPGIITSISYYVSYLNATNEGTIKIYMKEVSESSLTGFLPGTDFQEVYSGPINWVAGWNVINLATPFVYTGADNLLVGVIRDGDDYFTANQFKAVNAGGSAAVYKYSDSEEYNITTPPVSSSTTSYRPVIQLELGALDGFCYPPTNVTADVATITTNEATIIWNTMDESSTTFGLAYKAETDEEWTTASENISDTSYTITGLDPYTRYQAKVWTICDAESSSEKMTTFITLPTTELCIPIPYSQNFDDLESVSEWYFANNGANQWIIGSDVNNTVDENGELTVGNSLYISNDGGLTNAYTQYGVCNSHAYTLINIEEGNYYGVSFDLKFLGESAYYEYDYLLVSVVPLAQELGNSLPPTSSIAGKVLTTDNLWETINIPLPNDLVPTVYKLVFTWHNDSGSGENPPAAVDNVQVFSTSCARVNEFEVTMEDAGGSVTANIAVADSLNDGAEYIVEYRYSGDTTWHTAQSESPVALVGLPYSSRLDYRVTSNCSGDLGVTSDMFTVWTTCNSISEFPYVENFDTNIFVSVQDTVRANFPSLHCWFNVHGGSAYYYWEGLMDEYGIDSTKALYFYGASWEEPNDAFDEWLISPIFELTGSERLNFQYKTVTTTNAPVIDVYAMNVSETDYSAMSDTASFTLLTSINTQSAIPGEYNTAEIFLNQYEGNTRLALAVRQKSSSFYVDNFAISEIPACPDVYGLTVVPGNQVVYVNYDAGNITEDGVIVAYSEIEEGEEFDPTSATQVTISADATLPYTIEGMTNGSTYAFAAQQACGGAWTEAVVLTIPTAYALPLSFDFDTPETTPEMELTSTSTNVWVIGTAQNNTIDEAGNPTSGSALYISSDNGTTASYTDINTTAVANMLVSIEEGLETHISFDYKVVGENWGWPYDYLNVYLVPFGATRNESHLIAQNLTNQESWQTIDAAINGAYGICRLEFVWVNDALGSYPPGAIVDNLSIVQTSCIGTAVTWTPAPSVTEDGGASITVNVNDETNEGATYTLRYKESANTLYTEITNLTISDFPYTITEGVLYQTIYDVQLALLCSGEENLIELGTQSVTIPCAAQQVPWFEDFTTNVFNDPSCWDRYLGQLPATGTVTTSSLTSTSSWWNVANMQVGGASNSALRMNLYSTGQYVWAISPVIDLGEDTEEVKQIAFSVAVRAYGSDNIPNSATDDKFAVLVSLDNGATWDAANGLVFADGDADTDHNYSNLTNQYQRYAYRLVDANEEPITGQVRFAFYGGSVSYGGDNYLCIDNISVEPYSECPAPYGVSVSEVASSTATVSFQTWGPATTWEYVVAEGVGESADLDGATPVQVSTTDDIALTELNPLTEYTFGIRSVCEETSSAWTTVTFTTLAPGEPIPYSTTFDDSDDAATWFYTHNNTSNLWTIGTATAADEGGSAAYISNDNGVSYAASLVTSGITRSYIWKDFSFGETEDVFELSFDWKIRGRASTAGVYNGIIVYLADLSTELPTDDWPSNDYRLTLVYGSDDWTTERIYLGNVTGDKRLVFLTWGYQDAADLVIPAAIDNISIDIPSCIPPVTPSVTEITNTTTTLAWSNEEGHTAWNVYYKTSEEETYTQVATTTPSITLTELLPITNYYCYITAVCGSEESAPSPAISFTTECTPETAPWSEDFATDVTDNQCWRTQKGLLVDNVVFENESNAWYHETDEVDGNSTGMMRNNVYGSSRQHWLITPQIDLGEGGTAYQVSLDVALTEYNSNYAPDPAVDDRFAIVVSTDGGVTWSSANALIYANNDEDTEHNYSDLTNTFTTITFPLLDAEGQPLTGMVKIGLYAESTSSADDADNDLFIDNLSIEVYDGEVGGGDEPDTNSCDAPTALAASNITATSADITWTGSADSYEFRLNAGTSETLTATTKSLTGLTASTTYTVEVRAICGEQTSAWASTTFTTLAEQGGEDEVIAPTVTTLAATAVDHQSAVLNGTITAGNETITAQGFMYKATTATEWTTIAATGATISATVNGLTAETSYTFKAFATTASGTTEGTEMTFTTLAAPVVVVEGEVTTTPATEVGNTSATLNGALVSTGNSENYTLGFALATIADFTLETEGVQNITATATDATFSQAVTDLAEGQTYFFRAYITNEAGTAYGTVETFTLSGLNDATANGLQAVVYPNPANTQATLQINGLTSDAKIIISDLQGRILSEGTMEANTTSYTIDLSKMASGVYYIRIVADQAISTQKLIVE